MKNVFEIKNNLKSLTDLEWFDSFCELLKKTTKPTTLDITEILGAERPNPKNEIRGSKFLDPFDDRFESVAINPILKDCDPDKSIDYIGFHGNLFKLKLIDLIRRFNKYRTQTNTYDGGTQIFFYPVPDDFEFTAIDCWTNLESEEITNINEIEVNNVSFLFGNKLSRGRDGYSLKR